MRDTSFNFSTKDSQKPKVYQGGEIKVMKKSLSLLLAIAMVFTMFASVAFAAEDTGKTALDKFNELKEKGIIEGHANGTAGLDENMTRAQAAVVLTKLFGLDQENPATASFSDVPKTHWAYKFVEAAVKAGFINGLGNGKFAPSSDVTTQDLSVMVVLALGLETDANATVSGNVKDYAKKYVAAAIANGLLASQADYTKAALRSQLVEVAYSADQVLNPVVTEPAVASAAAKNNTTVEVVFDKELTATDKADFTFDNNLTVSAAELQADKKTVKLTTSAQTKDQVYKLSYKGKDTGKTVTGVQIVRVVVTPSNEDTLIQNSVRAYTAKFYNEDGSIYAGQVGIRLINPTQYGTDATDVYIEQVNGNIIADPVGPPIVKPTTTTAFAGINGQVTFTVRHDAGQPATSAIPVIWIDVNADGDYDNIGQNAPTEPYALGGRVNFTGNAAINFDGIVTVNSANASGKYFVGTYNAPAQTDRFVWDANDIFQINSSIVTMEEFEKAISANDQLLVSYKNTSSAVSVFNITDDYTAAEFKITTATTVNTKNSSQAISGKGQPGWTVKAYADSNASGTFNAGDSVVAQATIAADGTWNLAVPLASNQPNLFFLNQVERSSDAPITTTTITVNQGNASELRILTTTFTDNTASAGTFDATDALTLVFNKNILPSEVKTGTTFKLTDQDGTIVRLVVGTNATVTQGGTAATLVVTLNVGSFLLVDAAGDSANPGQLTIPSLLVEITGLTDGDGNAVKIDDAWVN